jgi:hypothetical protein
MTYAFRETGASTRVNWLRGTSDILAESAKRPGMKYVKMDERGVFGKKEDRCKGEARSGTSYIGSRAWTTVRWHRSTTASAIAILRPPDLRLSFSGSEIPRTGTAHHLTADGRGARPPTRQVLVNIHPLRLAPFRARGRLYVNRAGSLTSGCTKTRHRSRGRCPFRGEDVGRSAGGGVCSSSRLLFLAAALSLAAWPFGGHVSGRSADSSGNSARAARIASPACLPSWRLHRHCPEVRLLPWTQLVEFPIRND